MIIYIDEITPRAKYIFKLIFNELSGISFQVTSNKTKFESSNEEKICYSTHNLADSFHIKPVDLLFEKGVRNQEIQVEKWQNTIVLFPTDNISDLPFDIFAASFYMVSRYEEYLPFSTDIHGRFSSKESIAYKYGFIEEPVVNQWVLILQELLKKKFPSLKFSERKYSYQPTIDIDNAYAYLYKGFVRTAGANFKSILKFNWGDTLKRISTLLRISKDPYDTYNIFDTIHKKYKLDPIFFFLLADYNKFDKNPPFSKKGMKNLITQISKRNKIGIHPSYASNNNYNLLKKEIARLASICDGGVKRSRQHFLKLTLPETYRQLIKLGIKEDYSMGYAEVPGFRAGICDPFYFYDLLTEEETDLRIYPFQIMDGTLCQYMQLPPKEALDKIKTITQKAKDVNGTFISLWHNESLSEQREWKNWRVVYEGMIKIAIQR